MVEADVVDIASELRLGLHRHCHRQYPVNLIS
jgi:hypothetical protein